MALTDTEFLDAICASPELDEPRLAYATWLEQRGDPRGEFIRVSCTSGQEARAQELLARYGEQWTSIVDGLASDLSAPPRFERGFISELYLMGTFGELVLDFAATITGLRPVPVALILGAERVLLRADNRVYAWQSRGDNAVVIGTLPAQRELAKAPATTKDVQMLGFVADSLSYLVGGEPCVLRFSES